MGKPIAGRKPDADWTVEKSTLYAEIRRAGLKRLLLSLLFLIPVLLADTVPSAIKSAVFFRGPQAVTAEELTQITDPAAVLARFTFDVNREYSKESQEDPAVRRLAYAKNGSCYVRLAVEGFIETGLTVEEGTVTYSIARLENGRLLLMRRTAVVSLNTQKGTIGYLPADIKNVALEAISGQEVDETLLLPLFMDATAMVFDDIRSEILFSVGLLLLWGVGLFFAWRGFALPEKHEAYRAVYARAGSMEDTLRNMEEELLSSDAYAAGKTTVTKTWKLTRGFFSFTAEPRDFEKR